MRTPRKYPQIIRHGDSHSAGMFNQKVDVYRYGLTLNNTQFECRVIDPNLKIAKEPGLSSGFTLKHGIRPADSGFPMDLPATVINTVQHSPGISGYIIECG